MTGEWGTRRFIFETIIYFFPSENVTALWRKDTSLCQGREMMILEPSVWAVGSCQSVEPSLLPKHLAVILVQKKKKKKQCQESSPRAYTSPAHPVITTQQSRCVHRETSPTSICLGHNWGRKKHPGKLNPSCQAAANSCPKWIRWHQGVKVKPRQPQRMEHNLIN